MFDVFFIIISFLSISPLTKKFKVISLQSGLNCLKLNFKNENELLKST
jgi:hypothetical protein